jgi:predicted Fe-Mo cluster-binding NifX family protein
MPEKNFIKRTGALSLLIVFIMSVAASANAANMTKIAVAAEGQTATAAVGSEAARSSFFLIFDGDGKFVEAINNPHQKTRSGASPLVVNFLTQQGVNVFISQAFGEKMVGALKAKGIAHFQVKGSADDAVKRYLKLK